MGLGEPQFKWLTTNRLDDIAHSLHLFGGKWDILAEGVQVFSQDTSDPPQLCVNKTITKQ